MHPELNKYQAIIFDMDGTLLDSMPAHMEAWRLTAEAYDYPYDHEWHYSQGGVPTRETAERINAKYQLTLDPDAVAETKRLMWENMGLGPELIEETYELFNKIHGHKPIAVGTGADRTHALEMLEETGILDKLDGLVTACDVSRGKPNPDTFLQAAEAMGVAPEHCVVFEDTEIGRQAALAAGMDCILVKGNKIQWPEAEC